METTQTIQFVLDKLNPAFAKLEGIGVAGWEVMVRQQQVEAIAGIFIFVFLYALVIVGIVSSIKMSKSPTPGYDYPRGWYNERADCPTGAGVMGIATTFVGVLTTIVFLINITGIIGKMINPAYYAIMALVNLVQ